MTPHTSRFRRRAFGVTLAASCLVMTACSDDSNTPANTPGSVPDGEETDLPDSSIDVSDGSGEGGNRSGEGVGDGTPQP